MSSNINFEKARDEYLKKMKWKWTPKEVETLLAVWKDYNQRQISERFIPTKTPIQVNQKKMHMGLKKPPVWTNEEREILLTYGADYTHRELQSKFFLDKNLSQISGMRKHLGIKRKRDIKHNRL